MAFYPDQSFSLVVMTLVFCLSAQAQTAPGAPLAPLYGTLRPTSATLTLPRLPANAASLSLQRSPNNSTWTTLVTGLLANANYNDTGLTPNTTYYYRSAAVNQYGSSYSSSISFILPSGLPTAPAIPRFSNIQATALTVLLPGLPGDAATLTLQRSPNNTAWTSLTSGLAGGSTYDDSGLTPNTLYYYRVVTVNQYGSTAGSSTGVTTRSGLPTAPAIPRFSNIQATTLTVLLPGLPGDAATLTLQRSPNNSTWTTLTSGLAGGSTYDDSGLLGNTTYYYRVLTVNQYGSTAGSSVSIVTRNSSTPNVPVLENVQSTTLTVVMPALFSGATSLSLQRAVNSPNGAYTTIASSLSGNSVFNDSGLTPSS